MKPRIKLMQGIWQCGLPNLWGKYMGHGSTPLEAFRDWLRGGRRNG